MMKKLVALLMALALLCSSIGAFATEVDETVEETAEESAAAEVVETEEETEGETEEEVNLVVSDDATSSDDNHQHDKKLVKSVSGDYCTDPTINYYECKTCGATWTETVEGTAHKPGVGDQTSWITEPTCTTPGSKQHTTCLLCNIGKDKGGWIETVKANGHSYDPDKEVKHPATCTADGTLDEYCTVCKQWFYGLPGEKATQHKGTTVTVDVDVPATCVAAGQKGTVKMCSACGYIFEEDQKLTPVPVLNHADRFLSAEVLGKYFTTKKEDKADPNKITYAELTAAGKSAIKNGVITVAAEKKTVLGKEYVIYGKTTITYVPATCVDAGSITFKCEACAKEYKIDLPAMGHLNETKVQDAYGKDLADDKAYDCVKGYSIVYKCMREGCDYIYNVRVQETAHDFTGTPVKYLQKKYGDDEAIEYTKAQIANCLESWEVYKCQNPFCKVTTTKHVDADPKAVHEMDKNGLYRETDSTCIELGGIAYNCAKCFYPQYKENEKYADHQWTEKVTKAASCTENGERVKTCSYCGKVETEVIPAIGHNINYKKPEVIVEANCKKGIVGTKGYVCQSCGFVEKTWTYEGHSDTNVKYETDTAPTCTKDGEKSFYCPLCCKLVKEIIPATGHSYEYKNNDKKQERIGVEKFKAAHEAACTPDGTVCKAASCSAVNPHGDIHSVVCTECKASGMKNPTTLTWTETKVPAHKVQKDANGVAKNFTIDVAPTCCKAGSATFTCATCGEAVKGYVLPALGHNKVPAYDAAKSVFVLKCKPLAVESNNATLLSMMKKAGYSDEVAKLVAKTMLQSATTNYRGIGCDWTEDMAVKAPKYNITVNGSDATIKLQDTTMEKLPNAYLRVNWRYRLTNGDTVSFNYTFMPEADGSYFIDAPDCDGKLEMTYIEVVAVRTAHRLDLGEYATYGSKKL